MIYPEEVDSMISDFGETIVLRRMGSPNIDISCIAMVIGYQPQELGNGIIQGDRKVRIGNAAILGAAWPGPPRKGDQVIVQGKVATIQGVDTSKVGANTLMHIMQIRGS